MAKFIAVDLGSRDNDVPAFTYVDETDHDAFAVDEKRLKAYEAVYKKALSMGSALKAAQETERARNIAFTDLSLNYGDPLFLVSMPAYSGYITSLTQSGLVLAKDKKEAVKQFFKLFVSSPNQMSESEIAYLQQTVSITQTHKALSLTELIFRFGQVRTLRRQKVIFNSWLKLAVTQKFLKSNHINFLNFSLARDSNLTVQQVSLVKKLMAEQISQIDF